MPLNWTRPNCGKWLLRTLSHPATVIFVTVAPAIVSICQFSSLAPRVADAVLLVLTLVSLYLLVQVPWVIYLRLCAAQAAERTNSSTHADQQVPRESSPSSPPSSPHALVGVLFTLSLQPTQSPRNLAANLFLALAVAAPAIGALLLAHVKQKLIASAVASAAKAAQSSSTVAIATQAVSSWEIAILNMLEPLHFAMAASVRPLLHIIHGRRSQPADKSPNAEYAPITPKRPRRHIGVEHDAAESHCVKGLRKAARAKCSIPSTHETGAMSPADLERIDDYSRGRKVPDRHELSTMKQQLQSHAMVLDLLLAKSTPTRSPQHAGMVLDKQPSRDKLDGLDASPPQLRNTKYQPSLLLMHTFGWVAWSILIWLRWAVIVCTLPITICNRMIQTSWWVVRWIYSLLPTSWRIPPFRLQSTSTIQEPDRDHRGMQNSECVHLHNPMYTPQQDSRPSSPEANTFTSLTTQPSPQSPWVIPQIVLGSLTAALCAIVSFTAAVLGALSIVSTTLADALSAAFVIRSYSNAFTNSARKKFM